MRLTLCLILVLRLFGLGLSGCDLSAGLPPFYVVHKVEDAEITVDGIGNEKAWQDAPYGKVAFRRVKC